MARAETSEASAALRSRIAVLPLDNISPEASDAYFADGMTEELISALSRIPQFRVIARTSAMRYRGVQKGIAEIGRELGVGTIIEGSVRKSGSHLRITVQLIDAGTEEHLWSQDYDRELADVFEIQRDIARRIARALKVRLPSAASRAEVRPSAESLDAYTLYLNGRYHWNQRTLAALTESIRLFESALARDQQYALALTGLADAYAVEALLEFVAPTEAFPKARAAAERATELDPNLAEAHASLGLIRFQYDRDWPSAERELRRALELNPNNPLAHQYYADFLKAMGRFDEALTEMERALELDPVSMAINTGLGHVLYLSRQYDRAIEQYRKALALDPSFVQAHLWFGRPYLEKGMYAEAVAELREAVRLSQGSTISLAVLGHALASAGERPEAMRILDELTSRARTTYVPSYWIGLIYTGLDDKDSAMRWLERAYAERSSWLAWIKVEPRFDRLRGDPRFESLLRRMHLTDEETGALQSGSAGTRQVREFIRQLAELRLSRFAVVGRYTRFDEAARHALKDLCREIAAGVRPPARTESFLIWAPPGSGKTFLVQEAGRAAGDAIRYLEVNLAEVDEVGFRTALAKLRETEAPTICLVDEADSQPQASWPYEALLPVLEPRTPPAYPRVYVLVGSTGTDLAAMRAGIEIRPKGRDLLSRIPGDHQATIPPVGPEDRVIVAVSTLLDRARTQQRRLREVERLALYYLAVDPELASPRRIRDAIGRAVDRLPPTEDRLKFDHLFQPGDSRNKQFWLDARSSGSDPLDGYVPIEE